MPLALSSTGTPAAATACATARVLTTRLSRISRLYDDDHRLSPTPAPLRCTTASRSPIASGAREVASHCRSPDPLGGCRTNRTAVCSVPSSAFASAVPRKPDDPVMPTFMLVDPAPVQSAAHPGDQVV